VYIPTADDLSWQVDFSSGKPVFRTLDPDQCKDELAQCSSMTPVAAFLGFNGDWGDVLQIIKDGVASLTKFNVCKAKKEIEAWFCLVIKGVNYAYKGAINVVEQAFDLAEEVLRSVGARFEDLFGWLGDIFNWDDIRRTYGVIQYSIEQVFPVVTATLQKVG